MRNLPSLRSTLAVTLSLLVACSRASAPVPKLGGVLAVGKPAVNNQEKFGVVFAGPTGEVAPESEIQIVFSRPVRPLSTLANAEIPHIEIRPAIAGTWRWIGTQALVFAPTQHRLPYATAVDVTVPADVRALDGSVLGAPYPFRFRTPAPKLVRATATDDREHLRENSQFELTFDQPVAIEQVRGRLRLEANTLGDYVTIPYQLQPVAEMKPNQGFRVVPRKSLPRASQIRLIVAKGLIGTEGGLATAADQAETFSTVSPLQVEKVDCDRATPKQLCDARSGVDLVFNNPVSVRELKKHLSVDGVPGKIATWYSDEEFAAYVHVTGPFRVGGSSALRISAGLRDEFRQPLAAAYAERIRFDDLFPAMALGMSGEVFETTASSSIPVGMVNVADYERLFVPLSIQSLAALLPGASGAELFALGQRQPNALYEHRAVKFQPNQMGIEPFDPNAQRGPWLGAGLLGVRFAGVAREGDSAIMADARLIQRTNLGITGQIGRHGSAVWVTELDSGKPVPNAEVFVLHADATVRETVRTDAQGVARLSATAIASEAFEEPEKYPAAVVTKLGEQLAYRRLSDLLPEWRIPVSVDRSGRLGTRVMLFSERGLYRPGERIDLKAILREEQPRGLALPKQSQVRLDLLSPDNQKVASKSATLSSFGTTAAQFGLPLAASTGQWSVRLSQGKEELATTSLTVGEYRPVELEVSVVPAQSELIRGGQLKVAVSAKTLFGLAASGAKARLEAHRERTTFVPRGASEYVTDADVYDESRRDVVMPRSQLLLKQSTLDTRGRTDETVAAELPGALGPEWVHFEAEVSDASQNPVAASARTLVHPADYYVALKRLKNSWISAPGRLSVDVTALSPDGSRKLDRRIDVELLHRKWSVVRGEEHGVVRSSNEPSDEVLGRCEVRSAITDRTCSFDVKQVGSYFVLARSHDEKNRQTRAAQALYAVGEGQTDYADTDDHRVELVPDKTEYNVGDVARVLVKTAVTDAEALITTGRSEVHSIERRTLKGSSPVIEVPIREDMRPNLFVMLNLVTGRKRPAPARADQPDLGAPTYRMGWTELKIGTADRRLEVELTPSTRVALPGAEVGFSIAVRDKKGAPTQGEVTLWAVDEGVLALGDYQVPDPIGVFLGSRPLQLLPVESRDALGRRTLSALREELGLTKGASGAGGGEP
ncbi:MAG TPA: MG2 domain-containing protein, partial [Polyangiaceae bacterium]|nr:MG2 domain-containing protein [Polyangiaceae bacterium]